MFKYLAAFWLLTTSLTAHAVEISTCYARIIGPKGCLLESYQGCGNPVMGVGALTKNIHLKTLNISNNYPKNEFTTQISERHSSVATLYFSSSDEKASVALEYLKGATDGVEKYFLNFTENERLYYEILGCTTTSLQIPL